MSVAVSKALSRRPLGPSVDHSRTRPPTRPRYNIPAPKQSAPTMAKTQKFQRPQMPQQDWRDWKELSLKLEGISSTTTTWNLYEFFQKYGNVVFIEIYEGTSGQREGTGKVKFCPPPREDIWSGRRLFDGSLMKLLPEPLDTNFKIQSPIKRAISYDCKMSLEPEKLDFGFMIDPKTMASMKSLASDPKAPLQFEVNLKRRRIAAFFKVDFVDPRSHGDTTFRSQEDVGCFDRKNHYMFEIPFSQLKTIHRVDSAPNKRVLVLSLDSPPLFFRKRVETQKTIPEENLIWTEFDSWLRQTDIVYDPNSLKEVVVSLHKERPVIDIGSWCTYSFTFDTRSIHLYDTIVQALHDFNIDVVTSNELQKIASVPSQAAVWSLIDSQDALRPLHDLASLGEESALSSLPFAVRYQLEVCISRNILNQHNISEEFVRKLASIAGDDPSKASNVLEFAAEQSKRIYSPMTLFKNPEALAFSSKIEVPHYCAYSRKATLTPTTIYFSSPTVETTNRVLRNYAQENKDGRFLRVQFTDELEEGRINSCADRQRNDELFTRVYRTLYNGIRIGDRHFQFLAFGNSQFRENGAYFFCPTEHLSCSDIRQWMGKFSHINVVAKYAARLGQCFSTTRAINGLSAPELVKIDDIKQGKYTFTDGVGKISLFLAQMITAELRLRVNVAPSAFQFRLGGCKGVLVVSPDAKDKEVHIRPSQQKFTATYNGLEIIRWSRFSCATLNRQTIVILSALGVPDDVFLRMLSEQLSNYQTAMSDEMLAQNLLSRYIDDNHMTISIATMINNGFMAQQDPFVMSLLHLWRSWSIKLLKEKAKIIVEHGAFLLGVVDETATLKGYHKPNSAPGEPVTEEELPEIFVQVPSKNDSTQYNVIEGICLVGRNPSLHPGDLRVVKAVNVKSLHHLRDVVVFPQQGERDVPSMCSGGDLDGDDFFVIWDKDLRPQEWNVEPMNYDAPKPNPQERPVQVMDLMKFFVRFMKNDSLPTIAHAHLAQADYQLKSAKDTKCLELAALHSKAVDYVKTGQPAEMPKRLRPRKWPHFMEKRFKPKEAIYRSHRILGQLYDKVESVDFVPQWELPFDKRILRAYKFDDALLKAARQLKSKYDTALLRIMAQQEITTEFEVWTAFVLSKPRVGSDYKVQEEMARISDALKDTFRLACIEKAGGKDFEKLGPFVAGMYKVTKEELDIALAECRSMKIVGGREVPRRKMQPSTMPLISFPWLFEKELARIATGVEAGHDLEKISMQTSGLNEIGLARKRAGRGDAVMDDYIQQEDGVIIHRGEELDLFRRDIESDYGSGESDFEEARSAGFEGNNGKVIDINHGGTGVEDVVPQVQLDGFVDPHKTSTPEPGQHGLLDFELDSALADDQNNTLSDSDLSILPTENYSSDSLEKSVDSLIGLKITESALDDFECMVSLGSQGADTKRSNTSDTDDDVEEEIIELEVNESAFDKLARLTGPG